MILPYFLPSFPFGFGLMSLSLRSKEPQLVPMGTSFPRHLFHQHSNCRRISVRETEYVPPVNCFISTKKKKEDMIYHNMHHFHILTLVEGIFIVVVSRGALHTTYPSNLLSSSSLSSSSLSCHLFPRADCRVVVSTSG